MPKRMDKRRDLEEIARQEWAQLFRMEGAPFGCWSEKEILDQHRRAIEAQRRVKEMTPHN